MILDARTIALLFVDGLSAVLIAALALLALSGRWGRRSAEELEDSGQLLALLAAALLGLRIVAWGMFFLVLDGYVPALADNGVMCAYGVVQLRPELAHALLWTKPAAVAGLIAWWSLALAEREVAGAPFLGLRFAAMAPIAAISAFEIAGEVGWLMADKLAPAVTCCSAALDPARTINEFRSTAMLGWSGGTVLGLLFASKILLLLGCVFVARAKTALSLPWTLLLCVFASAVAIVDLIAWREALAPRALGLEFHRCAYELVTRSLALGAVALLAALAHLGLLALPVLALVREREAEGAQRAARGLAGVAALFFATELVAVAVHLV